MTATPPQTHLDRPESIRLPLALLALLIILSGLAAFALVRWGDYSYTLIAGLPLTILGFALVLWNSHWALCYAAFCITPFFVVQREILGVTVNLPEALILALAIKEGARALYRRALLPPSLPTVPLLLFLAAAGIALITGFLNESGARFIIQDFRQFVEFMVLFWLVLYRIGGRQEATQVATAYVLGASLIAIHGIVQHYTFIGISETQISSDLVLHHGVRSGSFYGATTLGGLMVLAVGPAMGVLLSSRRRSMQALMLLCIALCLVAAVFTKTRGSWVGLLVSFALIAIAMRPGKKTLAAAAAVALVFALALGPAIAGRLATLGSPESDKSLMERAQYYTAAWHIGHAHPILGLGWGCYYDIDAILTSQRYVEAPRPELAEAVEIPGDEDAEEATVHSAYLQLFVKTGAIGLVAFLAIIVVWIERVWRIRKVQLRDDPGHALFIGITAGVAGYLFHSTFENFFQWPVMAQSFWLLLGLSFVTAPPLTGRPRYAVPLVLVGVIGVVFVGFMAYCRGLEKLHTDHFERNVAEALEEEDIDKALDIARRATEMQLDEPMPYTVYARVLLLNDQPEAALEQLDTAVGFYVQEHSPRRIDTGRRFYFAPARLTLGEYYTDRGEWTPAVENFELARVHADLQDPAFANFHSVLYRAYAHRGHWARALEFGRPGPEELEALSSPDLLRLARVHEGEGRWEELPPLIALLRARGDAPAQCSYLEGRVQIARGAFPDAIAALQRAPDGEVFEAPYFLGRALEASGATAEACDAYRTTSTRSPYRIPALARMLALLPTSGDGTTAAREDALRLLSSALASLQFLDRYGDGSAMSGRVPLAWSAGESGGGGRFPVAILWGGDGYNPANVVGARVVEESPNDVVVHLEGTPASVEVRWLENRVFWDGVERSDAADTGIPGWIDTGRDWFNVRSDRSVHVREADANRYLGLDPIAWVYPPPVTLTPGAGYLVAGRAKMPRGGGYFGWQLLGSDHRVTAAEPLAGSSPLPDWTWQTGYQPAPKAPVLLRLVLETRRNAGPVAFDDLLVLELPRRDGPAQ